MRITNENFIKHFKKSHVSFPRVTITVFHEKATSITTTPIVNVYKMISDDGSLKLVKESYPIESMQFNLNK